MQEKLQSWFNKTMEKWNHLEKRQKFRLVGAVSVLLLAIGLSLFFTLRPSWTVIYPNVDYKFSSDAQALLSEAGISSRMAPNGRDLEVDQKFAQKAIQVIETSTIKDKERYTFNHVLQNSGMGTTQNLQKQSLKRADETDLELILINFNGVEDASVKLVVPDDSSFFLIPNQEASASVTLNASTTITKKDGEAMASIIAKAVPKLEMSNISIVDQDYNVIYGGESQIDGTLTRQAEFEVQYQNIMDARVRRSLQPLFEDVRIIPNLVFNWDKISEKSTIYQSNSEDGTRGVIAKEVSEKQSGTNTTPTDAEPGVANNMNTTPNYNTQGGEGTSKVSIDNRNTEYLYDIIESVKEGSTGNFLKDESSMTVMAYTYKVYNQDALTKNNKLENTTWEDFKESIDKRKPIVVDPETILGIQQGTGIGKLTILAYEIPVFEDSVAQPLDLQVIVVMVLVFIFVTLLAYALIKKSQPDEITEIEPELSVEDLLVSTQLDEQKEAEAERMKNITLGQDSEVKKQIEKFVSEKPEAVAHLLRNWLNDEWD